MQLYRPVIQILLRTANLNYITHWLRCATNRINCTNTCTAVIMFAVICRLSAHVNYEFSRLFTLPGPSHAMSLSACFLIPSEMSSFTQMQGHLYALKITSSRLTSRSFSDEPSFEKYLIKPEDSSTLLRKLSP